MLSDKCVGRLWRGHGQCRVRLVNLWRYVDHIETRTRVCIYASVNICTMDKSQKCYEFVTTKNDSIYCPCRWGEAGEL